MPVSNPTLHTLSLVLTLLSQTHRIIATKNAAILTRTLVLLPTVAATTTIPGPAGVVNCDGNICEITTTVTVELPALPPHTSGGLLYDTSPLSTVSPTTFGEPGRPTSSLGSVRANATMASSGTLVHANATGTGAGKISGNATATAKSGGRRMDGVRNELVLGLALGVVMSWSFWL